MSDYFEVDFLSVETKKSGDAICARYELSGETFIHVIDGGYQDTGKKLVEHIKLHYGDPDFIDHVVLTHPDGDHAAGLISVLESFDIGTLWMHRPWIHATELIDSFENYTSVEALIRRLKQVYPYVENLEKIADEKGIPIEEPFQGAKIGAFTVMAPTYDRYLDLIVNSEKTPESVKESEAKTHGLIQELLVKATNFIKGAWGHEVFSPNETSSENEMSVVQFALLCEERILLTGDVGRKGLMEAAEYAPVIGLNLPGVDRFQVPHHGSRRNVSTETLDVWLGEKLEAKPTEGQEIFTAIISSAKEDKDHPRRSVVRAMIHRGAKVICTEGQDIRTQKNAPSRVGWGPVIPHSYPDDQEE